MTIRSATFLAGLASCLCDPVLLNLYVTELVAELASPWRSVKELT